MYKSLNEFVTAFPQIENKRRWTLSNKEKVPLDLMRSTLTYYKGFSKNKHNSILFTLDEIINIHLQNPHLTITYHLEKEDNIIAIDIEPEALKNKENPFFKINYKYAEWSTNKGIHAFIDNKKPYYIDKNIISLKKELDVEIFTGNHFIMFTGKSFNKRPKNTDNTWYEYLKERKKNKEYMNLTQTQLLELNKTQMLTEEDEKRLELYLNHFKNLNTNINFKEEYHKNKSDLEYRIICIILNTLYTKEYQLRKNPQELKYFTYFVLRQLLPYRDKFEKVINAKNLGPTTYLSYSIEKAYQFLKHQNNWETF